MLGGCRLLGPGEAGWEKPCWEDGAEQFPLPTPPSPSLPVQGQQRPSGGSLLLPPGLWTIPPMGTVCTPPAALRPGALLPPELGGDRTLNHQSPTLRVIPPSGSVLGAGDTARTKTDTGGAGKKRSWSPQPQTGHSSVTWISVVKFLEHQKPSLIPPAPAVCTGVRSEHPRP